MDWHTPLGLTRIVNKREKPIWYPPESVRKEHEADGRPLPKAVPPGPDNPLGEYAMRLGIPGGAYLIHGTNRPSGVGMQVTHGCVRMFPEDIKELYGLVPVNTAVRLVDQPYKMGWRGDELFMEVRAHWKARTAPIRTASPTSPSCWWRRLRSARNRQLRRDRLGQGRAHVRKRQRRPEPVMLHPAPVPSTVQVINDSP